MIWTTLPRFKTDNGLAVHQSGSGPALVMLHGVGLRSEAWSPLIECLRDEFSILAPDLPGHGDSQSLDGHNLSLGDYSDVIAAYLRRVETPVHLVGHSMGAMIALDIAIKFPNLVKSVCALNAIFRRSASALKAVQDRVASLKNITPDTLNTTLTLERWFGKNPVGNNLRAAQSCDAWLRATPLVDYQKAYEVFAHHDGPIAMQLATLERPALFVTGANEPNSTPDMSHEMAKLAPMGTVEIISGAAHMMPMTHAGALAQILTRHMKD